MKFKLLKMKLNETGAVSEYEIPGEPIKLTTAVRNGGTAYIRIDGVDGLISSTTDSTRDATAVSLNPLRAALVNRLNDIVKALSGLNI